MKFVCSPRAMWLEVAAEGKDAAAIQLSFYYPLLACVTVASFFAAGDFLFADCLKRSVSTLSAYLAGYFLAILTLVEVFSRLWSLPRNYDLFVRFVTYSSSLMLAIKLVVSLFSSFFFLLLANVYAAFLIWEGLVVLFPPFGGELKHCRGWATFFTFVAIYLYPNLFDALLIYLMK